MGPKKPVLLIQPGFAGDILFCMKIAAVWAQRGHRVVFPVEPRFAELRDALEIPPGVEMPLTSDDYDMSGAFQAVLQAADAAAAQGQFHFHQGPVELQDVIFLALSSSWRLAPDDTMVLKYKIADVDMGDWADYVRLKRNPEREAALLAHLGIAPGDDFVLVNEHCSTRKIDIEITGRAVRMGVAPGFTLIDWAGVAEAAREILTVDTSLVILIEILKLDKPLQMVARYIPPTFQPIEPLLRLKWGLALTPEDLGPPAIRPGQPAAPAPSPFAPAVPAPRAASAQAPVPLVFCFDAAFGAKAGGAIAQALAQADAHHRVYCVFSGPEAEFPAEIDQLVPSLGAELVKVFVGADDFAQALLAAQHEGEQDWKAAAKLWKTLALSALEQIPAPQKAVA